MKKVITIVLVFTIALNVLGFGFLNVRSSAEAQVAAVGVDDALISLFGSMLATYLGGMLGNGIQDAVSHYYNDPDELERGLLNKVNSNAFANGEVIKLSGRSATGYYFEPATGHENDETAIFIADFFNNDPDIQDVYNKYMGTYDETLLDQAIQTYIPFNPIDDLYAESYANVKNAALKALVNYTNHKAQVQAAAEAGTGVASTLSELGAVTYPFDFTGPIAEITMPTMSGSVSLDAEGFHFYSPYAFSNKIYFDTTAQALAHGGSYTYEHPNGDLYRPYYQFSSYGWGYYIVYNGDLFYKERQSSDTIRFYEDVAPYTGTLNDYWSCTNSQGVRFSDVFSGDYDVNNYYGGVFYMTEAKDSDHLIPGASYTTDDFTSSTGEGETISIPRSEAEEAIGGAIGLGLVSSNPSLTIGQDGSIEAVDGISLETLENLVSQLSEGTLKSYDSIEDYLLSIQGLLQAGNTDRNTINRILDNIRANTSSLSDINANIAAIAQALSIEAEAEIDLPDIDAETFIINHTGLAEAQAIVNGIPVVNQVTQLLSNVLDSNQYSSGAPNFRFYWDSDGDGTREVYNALDLSFLDNSIDTNTLSDSGRFSGSMTYRQFLHSLIIFLCYLGFGIKIIKKLPALFGGSESSNEFKSSDK